MFMHTLLIPMRLACICILVMLLLMFFLESAKLLQALAYLEMGFLWVCRVEFVNSFGCAGRS